MSNLEKPRRAHVLKIEFGANTLDDLCYQLKQTALDLRLGHISTRGCSGSPSCGFSYEYDVDESWTKDRYFEALDAWLGAQGIEAGTAATVKQGAVHESPVAESDAP